MASDAKPAENKVFWNVGRSSRSGFVAALVVLYGVSFLRSPLFGLLSLAGFAPVSILAINWMAVFVWGGLGLLFAVRRIHDLGLSAASLLKTHPFLFFLEAGSPLQNRYGPPPRWLNPTWVVPAVSLATVCHYCVAWVLFSEQYATWSPRAKGEVDFLRLLFSWLWEPAVWLSDFYLEAFPGSDVFIAPVPFVILMTIYSGLSGVLFYFVVVYVVPFSKSS
jgi:uncharacterized membrane protein YhaH (DUF805 family)